MPKTTKEVAEALGLKSRAVTTFAKRYGLIPKAMFGGMPMWESVHRDKLRTYMKDVDEGRRCTTCGALKSPAPAEEPGE